MKKRGNVLTGLERLHLDPSLLGRYCDAGAGIGLAANPTSVTADFTGAADVIARAAGRTGCSLVRLFGPEHGFHGEAQAGDIVPDHVDARTGIPVVSLYDGKGGPRKETFADLDLLVYDLQDAGLRWYTYLGTLTRIIDAVASAGDGGRGPRLLILDRPNPLSGSIVEGMSLVPGFQSLVGPACLPARHGLTLGEYAAMIASGRSIRVDVLRMEGWRRDMRYDGCGLPWVPPSPNLPTPDSLAAYAATCLLEGTNLSEGRGTTRPFEIFGAPWIDGYALAESLSSLRPDGIRFRPLRFRPVFSKHAGNDCGGIQLYIDPASREDLVVFGYAVVSRLRDLYPGNFELLPPWKEGGKRPITLLSGNDMIERSVPLPQLKLTAGRDSREFAEKRKDFLLYD